MPYLSYLAQALVAVVFGWAGAAKLYDVRAFARYFRDLRVLPSALSGPAARGLAIVELGIGGLRADCRWRTRPDPLTHIRGSKLISASALRSARRTATMAPEYAGG